MFRDIQKAVTDWIGWIQWSLVLFVSFTPEIAMPQSDITVTQ